MKSKSKTVMRWGTFRFLGIWIFGYMLAWVASLFARDLFINVDIPLYPYVLLFLVGLEPNLVQAVVQKWVTQRGLGVNMRGWLRTSLLGGLAPSAILMGIYFLRGNQGFLVGSFNATAFFMVWLIPTAVVQAWWLRKRVKNAWLWAGASIVNATLFTAALQWRLALPSGIEYVYIALISLMMGIVSGTVMRHLWTQTPEITAEKAKSDQATNTGERLQLPDDASDETPLAQPDNYLTGSS